MLTKEMIEEIRDSGKVKTVSLDMFNSLDNLILSDSVKDHEEYTKEVYNDYLSRILEMDKEMLDKYLNALKMAEIKDNQSLEKEDRFLIGLYMQSMKENAIDFLLDNGNILTRENLIKGHQILLTWTMSDRFKNKEYRTDDNTFVMKKELGQYIIRYFALPHTDIEEAISRLVTFYNSKKFDNNIFIKTQIIHGLVATLQIFDDGNTRYARILQNIKLWELTNRFFDKKLSMPAIYGTRSYFPYRDKYRELIGNLAVLPNAENWMKWFDFNLNRIEDQIYFLNEKLSMYEKMIRQRK